VRGGKWRGSLFSRNWKKGRGGGKISEPSCILEGTSTSRGEGKGGGKKVAVPVRFFWERKERGEVIGII